MQTIHKIEFMVRKKEDGCSHDGFMAIIMEYDLETQVWYVDDMIEISLVDDYINEMKKILRHRYKNWLVTFVDKNMKEITLNKALNLAVKGLSNER